MARPMQNYGPEFPMIPPRWNEESRQWAMGLRNLAEYIQSKVWQRAWPVGSVILTVNEGKPFSFGTWEEITTGIAGVSGWKRVR